MTLLASLLTNPAALTVADLVAKAALIVGIAAAVTQLLRWRRASAATQHLVWAASVVALLALPVLTLAAPAWIVEITQSPIATPIRAEVGSLIDSPGDAGIALDASAQSEIETAPQRPALPSLSWMQLLAGVYLLGVIGLLLRLVLGSWSVARLARDTTPVANESLLALLRDLSWTMGIDRPVRLLQSDDATIPMTWGTRRPHILLPTEANTWPAERGRAVLTHELAHVVRFDCLTQWLASVACAFYWMHPAVWYAARRLRVERERACDDYVIENGMQPREYASELFEVAQKYRGSGMTAAAALGMARPSELEGRMLSLMDAFRSHHAASRHWTAAVAVGMAVILVPLGCIQPGIAQANAIAVPPAEPEFFAAEDEAEAPYIRRGSRRNSATTGVSSDAGSPPVLTAAASERVKLTGAGLTATASPDFNCVGSTCAFTDVEISGNRTADAEVIRTVASSDSSCRGNNMTYFVFQVDQPAEFIFDSTVTVAPSSRRSGGLAVQFVVDQRGQPEPGSLKILRSTDDANVARVRNAIPQWRFTPALYQGCRVRQLVQMEVLVDAAPESGPLPMYRNITAASDSASLVAAASDALQGRLFVTVPMVVEGYRREPNSVVIDLAPVSAGTVQWRNIGGTVRILADGRRAILRRR